MLIVDKGERPIVRKLMTNPLLSTAISKSSKMHEGGIEQKLVNKPRTLNGRRKSARSSVDLCYFENGDKYDGEWKNNKREGRGEFGVGRVGTQSFAVGTRYEGDWANDKMTGRGKLFTTLGTCMYSNGNKYEGDWVNGQMQGRGKAGLRARHVLLR